jgi:hypothetical protein
MFSYSRRRAEAHHETLSFVVVVVVVVIVHWGEIISLNCGQQRVFFHPPGDM